MTGNLLKFETIAARSHQHSEYLLIYRHGYCNNKVFKSKQR